MKKVTVYCGESVQDKCGAQKHPVKEVEAANAIVNSDKDEIAYSNSPDFISAVKYIAIKQNVDAEFFLNGVSFGTSIEEIYGDLNRAIDMVNELGATED
jgi:hypothetical protein